MANAVAMQPLRRPLHVVRIKNGGSVESRKRKAAVSRTCNENGGSDQVPADGGKWGALLSKREDPVVVVFDAHPARVPHDHMNRTNRATGPINLTSFGS